MATVADLGARTLRKLRVSLVPQALRAMPGASQSSADVAVMVLRDLGIPVPEALRPGALPPLSQREIAAAGLRRAGIGQATGETLGVVAQTEIAARGLRLVGVNPADLGSTVPDTATVFDRSAISRRTLLKLSVIASDETPSATDLADMNDVLVSIHDSLAIKDYVTWGVDAIPEHAAEHYVSMAANMAAPTYGRPASLEMYAAAEQMLRQEALTGPTAQARAMLKVAAVHAQLAADGVIDWTLNTIPVSAAEHYAMMTAALLAPVHGAEFDPQMAAASEIKIRRIALAGSLGLTIATEKAAEAHESLNALGVVSWPISAVPAAYADVYSVMIAVLMSSFVGLPRDPESRQADNEQWNAAVARAGKLSMIAGAQARAVAQIKSMQQELLTLGLASWDVDQIPAAMADAYASAVVAQMQAEVGQPVDDKIVQASYQRIKLLAMNGPAGQALAEQKVRAVHYSLAARGKARWSLIDIPLYAEEPYVTMAAAMLAPEVGIDFDPKAYAGAEMELQRCISLPSNRQPVRVEYF